MNKVEDLIMRIDDTELRDEIRRELDREGRLKPIEKPVPVSDPRHSIVLTLERGSIYRPETFSEVHFYRARALTQGLPLHTQRSVSSEQLQYGADVEQYIIEELLTEAIRASSTKMRWEQENGTWRAVWGKLEP